MGSVLLLLLCILTRILDRSCPVLACFSIVNMAVYRRFPDVLPGGFSEALVDDLMSRPTMKPFFEMVSESGPPKT